MPLSIAQLARDVDVAQAQLDRARDRLLAALTGQPPKASAAPAQRSKGPKPDAGSVSQRALALIAASPTGKTRGELLAAGLSEAALHSALKKHSAAKRITSKDGRWVAVQPKKKGP